jgi:hypothetical protein
MKWRFGLFSLLICSTAVLAQKPAAVIQQEIQKQEIEAHLTFLAADEMRGRDTGSPELRIAGNYLAAWFKRLGLKQIGGAENYFQPVELSKTTTPSGGQVMLGDQRFAWKESMLMLAGGNVNWNGEFVFVGYGSAEELSRIDVRGKMVLALAGARDADNFNKVFTASRDKRSAVQKAGAAGLVEILTFSQVPWAALVNFLAGGPQWGLQAPVGALPHVWVKPANLNDLTFEEGKNYSGSVTVEGVRQIQVPGRNVVGLIEGTDPVLKNQYIILTAHYDHVGVQASAQSQDSIFNGARDNAIGTVALMEAARYLSQHPPKRSVLVVALTSEEKGLLGSQWYADHPLVPLKQHVLNVNCDGVGYNDKERITSISLGRTSVDPLLTTAAKQFGLNLGGDPDPKENFFERSDQVSFARKGIPAIKLQPGLREMDDEIRKYYHRQADEVGSLDFDYLLTFYRTYVYAVHLLANDKQTPAWNKGDKFEAAAKELYK